MCQHPIRPTAGCLSWIRKHVNRSQKKEFRDLFISLRESLREDLRDEASNQIAKCLFAEPIFNEGKTVLIYIAKRFEVQTEPIFFRARSLNKRVIVPAFLKDGTEVVLSEWPENEPLIAGPFGVPMPRHIKKVDPCKVDLWIVPGVAFDTEGNRLGFGGGFFDRLMEGTKGFKIGLAFDFQVVDELPTADTDQPVHRIITEKRTIQCCKRTASPSRGG